MPFPCLETSTFVAFVADNSANGIHRTGHSGGSFLRTEQEMGTAARDILSSIIHASLWNTGMMGTRVWKSYDLVRPLRQTPLFQYSTVPA